MLDVMFTAIFVGAGLILIAVLTSVLDYRFGAPLLLVFLGVGLLVGEDGLGLRGAGRYMLGDALPLDPGISHRPRSYSHRAGSATS